MQKENKYIDAYYKIGRLTPRDMLDEEIKFSADLVKEACEKAIEYEKLKNDSNKLKRILDSLELIKRLVVVLKNKNSQKIIEIINDIIDI